MQRNNAIDFIKGVLIFFVVFGHMPMSDLSTMTIKYWIYLFHMPAFFIISALLVKKETNIIKTSVPIVAAYLFWVMFSEKDIIGFLSAIRLSNFSALESVLWFIPALILVRLFAKLSLLHSAYKILFLILGAIVIIFKDKIYEFHGLVPFGVDIAIYLMPIIILLQQLKRQRYLKSNFLPTILFLILTAFMYSSTPNSSLSSYFHKVDFAIFLVPGDFMYLILGAVLFFIWEMRHLSVRKNIISMIGKKTFPIFIFHMIFINNMPDFMQINSSIVAFLLSCLIIVLCVFISDILLRLSQKFRYIGA